MENNYTVYMHKFPNNKVYIGITLQKPQYRWRRGGRYNDYMKQAISKYGWDNIKHIILYEHLTKEEAEQKEIELIAQYKSNQRDYGYNIQNGGSHQGCVSEETKEKISKKNKGKEPWCKGKKFTLEEKSKRYNDEFKRKISKSHTGKPAWNKGLKTSEEVRMKISIAAKQAMAKDEVREKLKKKKNKTEFNVANAILGGM